MLPNHAPSVRTPRLARRLAAAGVGLLLAFAVGEAGARVLVVQDNQNSLAGLQREVRTPRPGKKAHLGQLIELHPNDSLLYKLRPGLDGQIFQGHPIRTNALGFRSRDLPEVKQPGAFRILGLGDSVQFGWGVADDETYLSVLERDLNQAYPERDWEVINTGVPGYNTVQELNVLLEYGFDLDPDLIVLGFVANDMFLPSFIRLPDDPLDLGRSYLIERLLQEEEVSGADMASLSRVASDQIKERDPKKVPRQLRHMVGDAACVAALRRIYEEASARGVPCVFIAHDSNPAREEPTRWQRLLRLMGENSPVLVPDLPSFLPDFLEAEGLDRFEPLDFVLSEQDTHPTALHHRLIAHGVLETLEASGWIQDWIEGH